MYIYIQVCYQICIGYIILQMEFSISSSPFCLVLAISIGWPSGPGFSEPIKAGEGFFELWDVEDASGRGGFQSDSPGKNDEKWKNNGKKREKHGRFHGDLLGKNGEFSLFSAFQFPTSVDLCLSCFTYLQVSVSLYYSTFYHILSVHVLPI